MIQNELPPPTCFHHNIRTQCTGFQKLTLETRGSTHPQMRLFVWKWATPTVDKSKLPHWNYNVSLLSQSNIQYLALIIKSITNSLYPKFWIGQTPCFHPAFGPSRFDAKDVPQDFDDLVDEIWTSMLWQKTQSACRPRHWVVCGVVCSRCVCIVCIFMCIYIYVYIYIIYIHIQYPYLLLAGVWAGYSWLNLRFAQSQVYAPSQARQVLLLGGKIPERRESWVGHRKPLESVGKTSSFRITATAPGCHARSALRGTPEEEAAAEPSWRPSSWDDLGWEPLVRCAARNGW